MSDPTRKLQLAGGTITGVIKFGASADVGISRNASGILEINSGTAGTYRDIKLRYVYGDNSNVWAKFTNADGVLLNYGSGASAGLLTMAPGLTYSYGGTEVLRVGTNKLSVNGLLGGGSVEATSYSTAGSIFYGKALASQTGSLIKLVDSADASVFEVTASGAIKIGGNQVIGSQQSAIADATDAAAAISQLNLLLAAARTHGLIAT